MSDSPHDDTYIGATQRTTLFRRLGTGLHKPALRVMLTVDVILILISAVIGLLVVTQRLAHWPDLLNIGRDQSIAEVLNFAKWGVMIWFSWRAFRATGHGVFLCLAIVFALILADDSLQLHELTEELLYPVLKTPQYDLSFLGSTAFFAGLGAVCLGILFTAWFRTPKPVTDDIWPLAFLFGWVVFFGIGVDMLHGFAADRSVLGGALLLIEDGGEMVFISGMAAYVAGVFGGYAAAGRT